MKKEEWEPIPQRKLPRDIQEELRIEIPPDQPLPNKKQKPQHEMGEGIDITPKNQNEYIGEDEEEN